MTTLAESALARKAALLSGARLYQGAECQRCGSCVRYVKNRACVGCTKTHATNAKLNKRDAAAFSDVL